MVKRKRERESPKVDEVDAGPDLLDDWEENDADRVRVRPQRPRDEVERRDRKKADDEPHKKERRRRREVIDF